MHKPNFTLQLPERDKVALRYLAQKNDLTIGRGKMADEGSIREMVLSLANGTGAYLPVDPENDWDLRTSDRLQELIKQNPDLSDLLTRILIAISHSEYVAFYNAKTEIETISDSG